MDTPDSTAAALIDRILTGAADLTLATLRADGSPHASTVNFAHSGWQLYTAISLDSGKAHDINHDHRVALTVNLPYSDWHDIQGLAIDGEAAFVTDPQELARVAASKRGHRVDITTFPDGVPGDRLDDSVIARLHFIPDAGLAPDPLAAVMLATITFVSTWIAIFLASRRGDRGAGHAAASAR